MTSTPPQIEIEFIYTPLVNFAMQQNHVPVVRKLAIKNITDQDFQNLSIEIIAEPEFSLSWASKVESIAAGDVFEFSTINLKLSPKYLTEITERITGHFTLSVKAAEEIIYKETHQISIVPFEHWAGIGTLPEMLTAFITPNHPEVSRIIKRASSILDKWTSNPSFDEYQTQNPDRVKKQMAAIYEAVAEMKLVYCTVPASFEETGQRVRLVDTIATQQMANCLDLSLLYASCLEAIGLHALIIIIKGHAFAGAWLVNDSFADVTNDDPTLLTKRMADGINEITVLEATCMNAGQVASFDDAIKAGSNHLLKEDEFHLFLDVKRARFSGVRPLPLRVQTLNGWEIVQPAEVQRDAGAPEEITTGVRLMDVSSLEVPKQRLWERKLLDLSLRNNLLNLRITKSTIQLIPVKLNQLEDALAGGAEFQILHKPSDWDHPLRHSGLYQTINQTDPINELVKHEFSQKRLRTYLPENELQNAIVHLYRSAKLSLEENGANTLFIALGVLKWYETNLSEKPRFAPILLLPVDIIKKSAQKGYAIRSREEDTMVNITLLEMLRQDFGLNINRLETLPKDDNGVDVKAVFNIIRQSIMSKNRWDVEEQACIGTFSFSKFIMWNDIHNNADKLAQNKIVTSLIEGKIHWNADENIQTDHHLDHVLHPSAIALPISADSSQLEAVQAAVSNNSFVLHGPPGTGKSQTITNIIANALYNGKKVLFVAEKMAALQVVQNRLESIGLGNFCLELHSNKSKKSAVLEQLKNVTELTKKSPPSFFAAEAERLHLLRRDVNKYVDALHQLHNFGFSLYDAFNGYTQLNHSPSVVSFGLDAVKSLTKEKITLWQDVAEELQTAGTICTHPHNHPLAEIKLTKYNQQRKTDARELLGVYINALNVLLEKKNAFCKILGIQTTSFGREQFHCLKIIGDILLNLPDCPASILASDNIEQTMANVQTLIPHGKLRDEFRDNILKQLNKDVLSIDARQSAFEWKTAAGKWFLPRWLTQNTISKALNVYATGIKISKEEVLPLLEKIIRYKEEQDIIENNISLSNLLAFLWNDGNADWYVLDTIAEEVIKLNRQGLLLFGSASDAKDWRCSLSRQMPEGSKQFVSFHEKIITDYAAAFDLVRRKDGIKKSFTLRFSCNR